MMLYGMAAQANSLSMEVNINLFNQQYLFRNIVICALSNAFKY